MRLCNAAVIFTLLAAAPAGAQPRFEVVSVRPCDPKSPARAEGKTQASGGRLTAECVTLDNLVRGAYILYADGKPWPENPKNGLGSHIPQAVRFQKIGGSRGWIASDRFTVNAKADGAAPAEMLRGPLMRPVLEERFHLKAHYETRDFPVYELAVAKGPPTLQPAKEGACILFTSGPPVWPKGQARPPIGCNSFVRSPDGAGLDVLGASLSDFSKLASAMIGQDFIDKTGIQGVFDLHLALTFNDLMPPRPAGDGASEGAPNDPVAALSAALGKLGLKLTPGKMRGQFVVIDSAEKPTVN